MSPLFQFTRRGYFISVSLADLRTGKMKANTTRDFQRGTRMKQARVGHRLSLGASPDGPSLRASERRAMNAQWDREAFNSLYSRGAKLHGLMGALDFSENGYSAEDAILTFHAHRQDEVGDLPHERFGLDSLFWLAVGCLPLAGDRVFSLEDPEPVASQEADVVETSSKRGRSIKRPRQPSAAALVHFDDEDNRYHRYQPQPDNTYRPSTRFVSTGHTSSLDRADDGSTRSKVAGTAGNPRLFSFTVTEERVEALVDVALVIGAENKTTVSFALNEVPVPEADMDVLLQDCDRTYVPCDRRWIRFGPRQEQDDRKSPWFLERADAQLLAQALLELPLCARGYLIHRPKSSVCREMLAAASYDLPRMIAYLTQGLDPFQLPPEEVDALMEALKSMWKHAQNYKYEKLFANDIYQLEKALKGAIHEEQSVALFIQVLVLTNTEFRDVMKQSLRKLQQCLSASVTVDMESGTVDVITVFGVVQKFPVSGNIDRTIKHVVSYEQVLLMALKAVVRSTFLQTSLNSEPLLDRVLEMEEITTLS